jgi:hypothetical protein
MWTGSMENSGQIGSHVATRPPFDETDQLHADLQRTLFDFLEFKMTKCATYAGDVNDRLRSGNSSGAELAFRNAEDAFESAQRCLLRVERDDWRQDAEVRLSHLGLTLDGLWVKLISGRADC